MTFEAVLGALGSSSQQQQGPGIPTFFRQASSACLALKQHLTRAKTVRHSSPSQKPKPNSLASIVKQHARARREQVWEWCGA